jgi:hypothetical protein
MRRDDDQLLTALAAAVRAGPEVPRDFIEAGQAAYSWRTIDAELATLSYDSQAGQPAVGQAELAGAGMRAEPAVLRALSFTSGRFAIEVQIGPDGLLGQLAPPAQGQVEVQFAAGSPVLAPIDGLGWFAVRPAPDGPFRLRVMTAGGADVLTGWITPA